MPEKVKATSFDHARPQAGEPFTPSFWTVDGTQEPDKVNCEIQLESMKVAWSDHVVEMQVPVLTNSKPLRKGDTLVRAKVVTSADAGSSKDEHPAKKARISGARKGTSKGKA